MTDRVYLRANFSTATTPVSGGRLKDPYGHEYASLPLQLPSNLVDTTKTPKAVEMMITKMNIPLGSLPIAQIPLETIDRYSHREVVILTKGIMTIWPFMLRSDGILSGGYDNFPSETPMADWPVHRAIFPIQSFISERSAVNAKLRALELSKMLNFYSIEDVMEFLNVNFNDVYTALFANSSGEVDEKFIFTERNSRLHLQVRNMGADQFKAPFSYQFTDSYDARPYATDGRILKWRTSSAGLTVPIGSARIEGFSIVVNEAIRNLFPRLPWRQVNNDELEPVDMTTKAGEQIPYWKERNDGDPMFYVLDTLAADSSYEDNGMIEGPLDFIDHLVGLEYNFDGCNLISMVPIQAFIVMLTGVGITQQTYPVNVSAATMPSALTTSIPIVEVYYPLWSDISDLSTNIIISKDAFTNAAPFVLDQNALRSRDIKFSVYYITTDGKMHELTIPPGSSLSLQACYSIRY